MLLLAQLLRLEAPVRLASIATIAALLCASPSAAQTYTTCNPTQGTCPADTALGKSISVNFASGASNDFYASGTPTYDSNGVSFTVAKSGDAPQLNSKWYIMFGKVEITLKAAPGVGMVSSSVLQSDDLDEIDWEWLGAQDNQVQSNYFGKGQTTTYDRSAVHTVSDTQTDFHTYTVDWTSTQIVWQIDGTTVRVLKATDANGQYPQTPMQLKFGAWSGGDPSNAAGTIAWAGGNTDYSAGPYTMVVKSVAVTDYSTGTSYSYGDTSGSWQSIKSNGGSINSGSSNTDSAAPAITSTTNGNPVVFGGTHKDSSSTYTTPSVYPWVPESSTMSTSTVTATTYPGLPSGWSVDGSGKVVPPSAAPSTYQLASSTSSAPASGSGFCSGAAGFDTVTSYNEQGFLTTATIVAGASKSYDVHGFLVTASVTPCQASPAVGAVARSDSTVTVLAASAATVAVASGSAIADSSGGSASPTSKSGASSVVAEVAAGILGGVVAVLMHAL
ncbi:transglycosylase [Taxawa tesnikishii (nom. ined.)]|nr:transglycosylase [Dothideales sp. JES 119]